MELFKSSGEFLCFDITFYAPYTVENLLWHENSLAETLLSFLLRLCVSCSIYVSTDKIYADSLWWKLDLASFLLEEQQQQHSKTCKTYLMYVCNLYWEKYDHISPQASLKYICCFQFLCDYISQPPSVEKDHKAFSFWLFHYSYFLWIA